MKVTIIENCHHTRSCSRPAKRIFCGCSSLQSRRALIFFPLEKKPFKKLETIFFLKIRKTSRTENLHFGEKFSWKTSAPGFRRTRIWPQDGAVRYGQVSVVPSDDMSVCRVA